ncbi:MAG TPA: penicillin-binding transpeptidase domain-containing protein [Gemmatimonadales bacterium]|nr:penicillin-binding transpeptidase domain-containing protein [Gemmatimonadales bacterium]
MAKPAVRLQALQVAILAGLAGVVLRAGQVQVLQGRRYAEEERAQRTERLTLDARRGGIYDRTGTAIALTQETYHVGIAPNELRDPARDAATIARALHLPAGTVLDQLRKRYLYYAGPYSALEVQRIRTIRGVHLEPVLNRFYPSPDFARAVVGRVGTDGHGASGLERNFDSLLAGKAGAAVVLKDRAGREYESPARLIAAPEPGSDIVLTLDAELQEIAERALHEAVRETDAAGGDVVILDPKTGELLAVASERKDGSSPPSAFTDTYEPGSLAKIFAAAALLELDRVHPADRVSGENGRYKLPGRPVLQDEHPLQTLTLADAIAVSSNIAMAKFAQRMSPREQYAVLRDFGLGTPTGVEYPSESPGRLRLPSEWSGTSQVSLAIGYEVAVTPLQIAAAYGAIANDGVLLAPALVREVRDPSGDILYRHRTEPVRRVTSPDIARQLRGLLRGVVQRGTGASATLAHFELAAKTGTARRVVHGKYAPNEYTASFAALFPADDPQIVVVVKIDDPDPSKKGYFSATTAAPVTRSLLEQALASRTVTLNEARLVSAPAAAPAPLVDDDGTVPYVVPWPYRPDTAARSPGRVVPDVSGQPLREAVKSLHRRGFRVALRGWGTPDRTLPAAGSTAPAGSIVTLIAGAPQ